MKKFILIKNGGLFSALMFTALLTIFIPRVSLAQSWGDVGIGLPQGCSINASARTAKVTDPINAVASYGTVSWLDCGNPIAASMTVETHRYAPSQGGTVLVNIATSWLVGNGSPFNTTVPCKNSAGGTYYSTKMKGNVAGRRYSASSNLTRIKCFV